MKPRTLALAGAALALTFPAAAQTFRRPHFFVFSYGRPDSDAVENKETPDLTAMVKIWGYADGRTAVSSAQLAAEEIVDRFAANHLAHLEPGEVCISIQGFADPVIRAEPPGFFTEADRWQGMPDDLFDFPSGTDTFGTCHHPFLSNANPDPNVATLKRWMQDFVNEYEAIRTDAGHTPYYPQIPVPSRFYLDSEPQITWAGNDANSVWMLFQLSRDPTWYTQEVPGYPPGTTLHDLYEAQRAATGFNWPPDTDIENGATGLRSRRPGDDDHNRSFMLWWSGVCEHADNAVFKNCVYDVVHAKWPGMYERGGGGNSTTATYDYVRCGNYKRIDVDYENAATGWFVDSFGTANHATGYYPPRGPNNMYPRGWIEPFLIGGLAWTESTGKWICNKRNTSADVFSPELYLLDGYGQWTEYGLTWGTHADGSPVTCHQQPNLYLGHMDPPGQVLETLIESSLRLMRHTVEACIDSYGGRREGQLVPWVHMAEYPFGGYVPPTWTDQPRYVRRVLSMLRAKNVGEMIFFSGLNAQSVIPEEVAQAELAWYHSQEIVNEVYAARVGGFQRRVGTKPTGDTTPDDPASLEFTLPVNGAERVVQLRSQVAGSWQQTVLEVDFTGLQEYPSSGGARLNDYMINVECRVQDGAAEWGAVQAFDWLEHKWYWVQQVDPTEEEACGVGATLGYIPRYITGRTYGFYTPDRSVRITCDLRCPQQGTYRQFVSTAQLENSVVPGTLRLRLVHASTDLSTPFTSVYDLVQVAPFGGGNCSRNGCAGKEYCRYATPVVSPPGGNTSGGTISVWEKFVIDPVGSSPEHHDDWNFGYESEPGHWPQECDSSEYLTNSRFSLPEGNPLKQRATIQFSGPVWTDAPVSALLGDSSPYHVWYWITPTMQWREVTQVIDVDIARSSEGSCQALVSSKATQTMPPGYYAVTFNAVPNHDPNAIRYALYAGGTIQAPGPGPAANMGGTGDDHVGGNVEYHFRLYPDCNNDGCIDATDRMCHLGQGTCYGDLDDGSGLGVSDGGVDINDLLYFIAAYELGSLGADLDDGSGTGTPDEGVDINDLLFFLTHYEYGC